MSKRRTSGGKKSSDDGGRFDTSSLKVMLEDFMGNFVKALILFVMFTMLRLVVEDLLGNIETSTNNKSNQQTDSLTAEVLLKLANTHKNAGYIHDAMELYDIVIDETANSTSHREQSLYSEAYMTRGTLLLVYAAKAMKLDPTALQIDVDTPINSNVFPERVQVSGPRFQRLSYKSSDSTRKTYSQLMPDRLLDEAILSLSRAARVGTATKERATELSSNLGIAVLTSQLVYQPTEDKAYDVIKDVTHSYKKYAAIYLNAEGTPEAAAGASKSEVATNYSLMITRLEALLTSIQEGDKLDILGKLRQELCAPPGYLKRLRGVNQLLNNIMEKEEDSDWEVISKIDGQVDRIIDLDTSTSHSDSVHGVRTAMKTSDSFRKWLPQKSHFNGVKLLLPVGEDSIGTWEDAIYVGSKEYDFTGNNHRVPGAYATQEVPLQVPGEGIRQPGTPQEGIAE
eukprot:TRINITY_DN15305_c0_g2_i1.p1 TRINITY_DN15305_c0_g2~~TRINITY_DN15305_c0_g2_i1.p1  ORF type:complete len:454 (+),score=88.56 TRINITY_DN15305_c0_g2_i1:63-1424(+)